MGTFHYDASLKVDFEDRVLAHLQIVIGAKLRRGESFYVSWRDDESVGDGRTAVASSIASSGIQVFRQQNAPYQPGLDHHTHRGCELELGPPTRT